MRKACGMPPLAANKGFFSSSALFNIRFIGLNASASEGRFAIGSAFLLFAKKVPEDGATLASATLGRFEPGRSEAFGVKVLADGFGLNSMALTLNLIAAEVGLMTRESAAGPVGGVLVGCIGMGVETLLLFVPGLY